MFKKIQRKARELRGRPFFRALAGKYSGRRGFVIGNGPSLRTEDLSLLQGEISIASNKIFLAFEDTDWRPTLYTVCDDLVWEKVRREIHQHFPSVVTPSDYSFNSRLAHYCFNQMSWDLSAEADGSAVSEDCAAGVFGGYTVTHVNLQLAIHMGLDPIFILGCDHFYSGESSDEQDKEAKVRVGGQVNHFHPDYRKSEEVVNAAPIAKMEKAYRHVRMFAEREGVRVFNATRGGHLDVFERANFDDVLVGPSDVHQANC